MNILHKVTIKSLLKNRTRTVVTIIGVILSAAMITAITTFISSLQGFMLENIIAKEGSWQACVDNASPDDYRALRGDKRVESVAAMRTIGYAPLEGGKNEYKPYLYIVAFEDALYDQLPVSLISGRLPQNEHELVVSQHIGENGGVRLKIGDTLSLQTGKRIVDGETLGQNNPFLDGSDDTEKETFLATADAEYTIVGICERPEFEDYSAPGYTVITRTASPLSAGAEELTVYVKAKKAADIYKLTGAVQDTSDGREENRRSADAVPLSDAAAVSYHDSMLRFEGAFGSNTVTQVFLSLGTILIALILFGSIALIYNAFSISVSERAKQFGLLSSVGATRRQLYRSVLYEGLVIGAVGVPLGILSGIGGIGVTLYCVRDLMRGMFDDTIPLRLHVSLLSVVIAAVIGFATILISAVIPARRASRASAIDAIRQSSDVRISARRVKTPKLVYRLFGLEGDLALKNFKRNKKRYRSTVVSLFMSIVLFIAASTFTMYLADSAGGTVSNTDYDVAYSFGGSPQECDALFAQLSAQEGVKEATWLYYDNLVQSDTPASALTDQYAALLQDRGFQESTQTAAPAKFSIITLSDGAFDAYARTLGEDPASFYKSDELRGIFINQINYHNPNTDRYESFAALRNDAERLSVIYNRADETKASLSVGIVLTDKTPFGLGGYRISTTPSIVIPYSALEWYSGVRTDFLNCEMLFSSDDPEALCSDMKQVLVAGGYDAKQISNVDEAQRYNRNLLLVVNIFSYGFITLISLISVANVFNTISTNIHLRRREFAMLKSVGMTRRGFNKMMNFECAFYGVKALLYGLPAAALVAFLIYKSIGVGMDTAFRLPWLSVGIATVSVFLVVFVTMLYAMRKIKKQNIIDALKNENL